MKLFIYEFNKKWETHEIGCIAETAEDALEYILTSPTQTVVGTFGEESTFSPDDTTQDPDLEGHAGFEPILIYEVEVAEDTPIGLQFHIGFYS